LSAHRRAWIAVAVVALCGLISIASALARSAALHPGAKGPSVTELQRQLAKTGLDVTPDGQYGPTTTQAVAAFQHAANLKVTGIADHATRHKLHLVTAQTAAGAQALRSGGVSPDAPPTAQHLGERIPLQKGMSGPDIGELQALLAKSGLKVTETSMFDTATYKAQRSFEHRTGLPVDGVVDAADIDALRGDVGVSDPSGTSIAPLPLAPGDRATIGTDGLAIAPASAPEVVQEIIAAGNAIATKPYRYGGGHGSFHDSAYDCSGSVSYALHGGNLTSTTMDSSELESWGSSGAGQWITIYANSGHTYMVVAGLRFDTSGASAHGGDRWQKALRSNSGYVVRHPTGY
jgi:peptidoglycan hydrolase-like protein with peptidoglycan-binding domain